MGANNATSTLSQIFTTGRTMKLFSLLIFGFILPSFTTIAVFGTVDEDEVDEGAQEEINEQLAESIGIEDPIVLIIADGRWVGSIGEPDMSVRSIDGSGDEKVTIDCSDSGMGLGVYSVTVSKMQNRGTLTIAIIQNGELQDSTSTDAKLGIASLSGQC